jgi:hypothetical protein
MQQQTLNTKGKENPTYLDSQMAMRTQIHLSRKDIVAYFVKAIKHCKDKKMLVVLFNTGNHLITLSISTKYDQVWYCDSLRPIDSRTGDRLTCDWSDVIFILDE